MHGHKMTSVAFSGEVAFGRELDIRTELLKTFQSCYMPLQLFMKKVSLSEMEIIVTGRILFLIPLMQHLRCNAYNRRKGPIERSKYRKRWGTEGVLLILSIRSTNSGKNIGHDRYLRYRYPTMFR